MIDETAALIAEELIERGFEVVIAYGGQEGLQALMKSPPDLVLCDIGMPVMTGFEVLQSLNELAPRFSKIPLIFLTALASRDDELKGRRLGADDYVTKPIDFDRLAAIIQSRLAGVARTQPSASRAVLNERQIQVLTLVALGNTSVRNWTEAPSVQADSGFSHRQRAHQIARDDPRGSGDQGRGRRA